MKTLIAMILVVGCGAFGQLSFTNDLSPRCITNSINNYVNINTEYTNYFKPCLEYEIKETVTTNVVFPQIGEKRNYYDGYFGMYLCDPIQDMNIKIIEVHKIKTLEFEYDGRRFVETLSDEIISTKRQRRVTTEEWVDE